MTKTSFRSRLRGLKLSPLRESVPPLVNPASSIRRIRDLYRHVRTLRANRGRTRLASISKEDRPIIARHYRVSAAGYLLFGLTLGASAWIFSARLPTLVVWVLAVCVPAYLFVALIRLWLAAMIHQGRAFPLTDFLRLRHHNKAESGVESP